MRHADARQSRDQALQQVRDHDGRDDRRQHPAEEEDGQADAEQRQCQRDDLGIGNLTPKPAAHGIHGGASDSDTPPRCGPCDVDEPGLESTWAYLRADGGGLSTAPDDAFVIEEVGRGTALGDVDALIPNNNGPAQRLLSEATGNATGGRSISTAAAKNYCKMTAKVVTTA